MTAIEVDATEGFAPRSECLPCGCIVHINARELSVRPCHHGCINCTYIMKGALERGV